MLYIATDIKNRNWLVYILDEFRRINKAEFDIRVIGLNEATGLKNVIYYTKDFLKNINFVNKSDVSPVGKTKYLSEKVFIIEDTDVTSREFVLNYDLFWNAFVFLSRYEEYLAEENGRKIQSYSFKHPRLDKSTFDIPIVNIFFNELERIIKDNFPNLLFGKTQEPVVELSHDVDYVSKTLQLRIKQTVFNIYNTLRSIYKLREFLKNSRKTWHFLISNPSYWCFDYWEELEKNLDRKSIFYIYVETGNKGFKQWLVNPSYDLVRNQKLQEKLKDLIAKGFEIGIHGSFNSAADEELLAKEKEILENCLGREINRVRQHWLRYNENITPHIHNKLFKVDSTLGWNDRSGFRSGCASKYIPYDHKRQRAFEFSIVPQIIMDSNICEYSRNLVETTKKATQMLKTLREHKASYVAISWHQRTCNSDYGWSQTYKELLKSR